MAFSAVNFNLGHPLGPFERPFPHLGLPDYLRIELTIAKALGVLALLIPAVPRKVKEFAYFGFGITLISASIAHFSVESDSDSQWDIPLIRHGPAELSLVAPG